MKFVLAFLVIFTSMFASPALAASVEARIDLSQQRMKVYRNGRLKYTWKISSGRRGYTTPTGSYSPKRMYRKYYSKKYNNAPMPHSIFFRGGYAVHGTGSIKRLGRVASHGCVRLHPDNARKLYNLVQGVGAKNARIKIRR